MIGQVAALVARWAAKIEHFIRGLLTSLRRLASLVAELGRILEGLRTELAKLAKLVKIGSGPEPWHEGDPVPPPRTGHRLPTGAKLLDRFRGGTTGEPRPGLYPDTVHYMTPAEREQNRLFADADGNLRSAADGSRFDTSTGVTAWSGDGRAIFVMDGSGNLYATLDQRVGHTHHSSLLGGAPVAGAGEIEVRDGRLVAMTDQSGHYRPRPAMNDRVLRSLRRQGVVLDPGFQRRGW